MTERPAPDPAVQAIDAGAEALLLSADRRELHVLNATAALAWACLDGASTVAEIAADIADVAGADPREVHEQLAALAEQLAEAGLLAGTADPPAVDGSTSRYLVDPPDH